MKWSNLEEGHEHVQVLDGAVDRNSVAPEYCGKC